MFHMKPRPVLWNCEGLYHGPSICGDPMILNPWKKIRELQDAVATQRLAATALRQDSANSARWATEYIAQLDEQLLALRVENTRLKDENLSLKYQVGCLIEKQPKRDGHGRFTK